MKYPAHIYAKALVEVLHDAQTKKLSLKEQDVLADNFMALVIKNGDATHLQKIVEEASRMAQSLGGPRKVVVESARALTAGQQKKVAHLLEKEDVVVHKIDPELIAGVRVTVNEELQFDGSLKRKLATLLPF